MSATTLPIMTKTPARTPAFGPWLRRARIQLGVTQLELARRSGINNQTISKLECGYFNPNWDTVFRLVKALGLTLGELDHALPQQIG